MKICEKRSLESQTIEFLRFPLAVMVIFIHSTRKPIPLNLDLLHENPLCIETFYNLCRVNSIYYVEYNCCLSYIFNKVSFYDIVWW